MKRIITCIALAGTAVLATAQSENTVQPRPIPGFESAPAMEFFNSVEWQKSFMGSYGVNPGVEPGIPEDPAEREVLGQIRTFLQTGTAADIQAAANAIAALIQQQRTEGLNTSPMLLQIAGTLEMQLWENATTEDQRKIHLQRAENYLKQAINPQTGFPNFLRAHKNLANLLFRSDRPKEAKPHFIRAIELGDREAVTYGLLGAVFMEEDKLVSAETALRNSLMINPNIMEFKQLLGQVLLQQERYAEANALFSELLQRRPNEVNFWMAQSNCYIAMDRIDEAARNLEIVRLMGKANVPSLMLLGDVYMNKEMIEEAKEAYIEGIQTEATASNLSGFIRSAESLNNFTAYEQAKEVIEAIESQYGDSLTTENEIDLLSLRSEINISLGKGEEAAENLEALLQRDPFNARALLSLGRFYSDRQPDSDLPPEQQDLQERRDQQQAIIYYERAQDLDDERAQVRAYVGEAQLRVQRDELQEAADLLESAQAIEYQDTVQTYLDQIRAALRNRSS